MARDRPSAKIKLLDFGIQHYIIYQKFLFRDVLFEFHHKFWNTVPPAFVFHLELYYKVDF